MASLKTPPNNKKFKIMAEVTFDHSAQKHPKFDFKTFSTIVQEIKRNLLTICIFFTNMVLCINGQFGCVLNLVQRYTLALATAEI